MTTAVLTLLAVFLAAAPAPETPAEALTRGRLESDLGRHASAATAFLSVASAPEATPAERWEALVRLGTARREAGDAKGAMEAFEETWKTYDRDPAALRFLLQALGSALPGEARWKAVWPAVRVEFGSGNMRPGARVVWPDADMRLCPCTGAPIDVSYSDRDLQDVLREMADTSRLNVVVQPGVKGTATLEARRRPWDEVLESVLAVNGFVARRTGNVVWVGRASQASPHRSFSGKPITFDYRDADLVTVLHEVAANGAMDVQIPAGVSGRVWVKLVDVPWDQAFDLLVNANGLQWTRNGNVAELSVRPQPIRR